MFQGSSKSYTFCFLLWKPDTSDQSVITFVMYNHIIQGQHFLCMHILSATRCGELSGEKKANCGLKAGGDSLDSETMKDYDDTTAFLGQWGRFQQIVFFLLCASILPNGFGAFSVVFLTDIPSHHCLVPEINLTQEWRIAIIPIKVNTIKTAPGKTECSFTMLFLKYQSYTLHSTESHATKEITFLPCICCNICRFILLID